MRKCLNCNKKTDNPKFCSLSCSNKYRKGKKLKPTILKIKVCPQCENPFEVKNGKNKFCSISCSATYNNALRPKRTRQEPSTCLNCSKEINDNRSKRKYCSNKCSHEYKKKQTIANWLNNPDSATQNDGNLSSGVRNYLIEHAGNKCACGFNKKHPITGKVPLTINHIDGNSRNNSPDNLEVLCHNCHALTPNFGALNKGNSNRLDRRHKYRKEQIEQYGEYKFFD